MDVIGLTGGIAAGKSVIARRLAEHGAVIIDADQLARDAVAPGSPGLAAVAERFGPDVIAADGTLDRDALGRIVFADAEARSALNGIVHPEVRRRYREAVETAEREDPRAIVVYDVPLLAEARARDEFALVVVADAPADARRARLIEQRGMDPAEADRRIAAQISDEERRDLADVLIDTSGTLEETLRQADVLWEQLRMRATAAG